MKVRVTFEVDVPVELLRLLMAAEQVPYFDKTEEMHAAYSEWDALVSEHGEHLPDFGELEGLI